jgi:aquaporin Z
VRKYLTEFTGTLLFVFIIGLIVTPGPRPLAPMMIGAALMVLVYMGGHVSGGHYNPAVSFAIFLRGKLSGAEALRYVVAQILGGTLGAYLSYVVLEQTFGPAPADTAATVTVLLVEGIFTFMLALVVLNVAVAKETQGNSFYGLAIGFTIAVAVFAGGPISGGVYNPAVGTGASLIHAFIGGGDLTKLWLYLVGPLAGGALAAFVFKLQHPLETTV